MSFLQFPLPQGNPYFSMDVELDGVEYQAEFKFNTRDDAWYMSLYDIEGLPLRTGVRIVNGWQLFRTWTSEERIAGKLVSVNSGNLSEPPNFSQFGLDAQLIYVEKSTVALLPTLDPETVETAQAELAITGVVVPNIVGFDGPTYPTDAASMRAYMSMSQDASSLWRFDTNLSEISDLIGTREIALGTNIDIQNTAGLGNAVSYAVNSSSFSRGSGSASDWVGDWSSFAMLFFGEFHTAGASDSAIFDQTGGGDIYRVASKASGTSLFLDNGTDSAIAEGASATDPPGLAIVSAVIDARNKRLRIISSTGVDSFKYWEGPSNPTSLPYFGGQDNGVGMYLGAAAMFHYKAAEEIERQNVNSLATSLGVSHISGGFGIEDRYPLTADDTQGLLGLPGGPDHLWRFDEAVGVSDLVGTVNLTTQNASAQYSHEDLGNTLRFNAVNSRAFAGSATDLRPIGDSWAMVIVGDFTSSNSSNTYYDHNGGGDQVRMQHRSTNDNYFYTDSPEGSGLLIDSAATAPPGVAVIAGVINRTTKTIRAYSSRGGHKEVSIASVGDIEPTLQATFGSNVNSCIMDLAWAANFTGAAAEAVDARTVRLLCDRLGLPFDNDDTLTYPLSAAEAVLAMGITDAPDHLWVIDGEDTITDRIGSANLSAFQSQNDAYDHPVVGECGRQGESPGLISYSNSDGLTPGAESWALVQISAIPSVSSDVHSLNFGGGPLGTINSRYRGSDQVSQFRGGSTTKTIVNNGGGGASFPPGVHVHAVVANRTTNLFQILDSNSYDASIDITGLDPNEPNGTMYLGTTASQPNRFHSWACLFRGSSAEQITPTVIANLAAYVGIT